MSKADFLFGLGIGILAVGIRELAFASFDRAPIQDSGQRLNMSAVGRNALTGSFVIPYSSDAGNSNPALDPGVPADGNAVLWKDTPTTLKLSVFRRGVGFVGVQLT